MQVQKPLDTPARLDIIAAGADQERSPVGRISEFQCISKEVGFGHGWIFLIDGGADNDIITGDSGYDQINGGSGNDAISGGDGDDTIHGGAGNDTILGGTGADVLRSGSGSDRLLGGNGNDRFEAKGAVIATGDGDDTIVGSSNSINEAFAFDFDRLLV